MSESGPKQTWPRLSLAALTQCLNDPQVKAAPHRHDKNVRFLPLADIRDGTFRFVPHPITRRHSRHARARKRMRE